MPQGTNSFDFFLFFFFFFLEPNCCPIFLYIPFRFLHPIFIFNSAYVSDLNIALKISLQACL